MRIINGIAFVSFPNQLAGCGKQSRLGALRTNITANYIVHTYCFSSQLQTANKFCSKEPSGTNIFSKNAEPMVKPQAPESQTSLIRSNEAILPAETTGIRVA